jgi:hypothetical protein
MIVRTGRDGSITGVDGVLAGTGLPGGTLPREADIAPARTGGSSPSRVRMFDGASRSIVVDGAVGVTAFARDGAFGSALPAAPAGGPSVGLDAGVGADAPVGPVFVGVDVPVAAGLPTRSGGVGIEGEVVTRTDGWCGNTTGPEGAEGGWIVPETGGSVVPRGGGEKLGAGVFPSSVLLRAGFGLMRVGSVAGVAAAVGADVVAGRAVPGAAVGTALAVVAGAGDAGVPAVFVGTAGDTAGAGASGDRIPSGIVGVWLTAG